MERADILQSKLNNMMQHSASWLDNVGVAEQEHSNTANAAGYLKLAWLPRTANLDDFDAKFKVYLNLPNWNERFALVVDNDDENELQLDYEATPLYDATNNTMNVALQYLKVFNNRFQIKNRVGVTKKQLYLRSEMKFNWRYEHFTTSLLPRVDYYVKDGWGPGLKGALTYPLENSYFSLSASWQKIQSESKSRNKLGLYYITPFSKNHLLVSGMHYKKDNNKRDESFATYYASVRYRNVFYKDWLFVELEPFVEFRQINDYHREVGIALNLFSYYGS